MYLDLLNSDKKVKLCRFGFALLKKMDMESGWRIHSHGYAVLQYSEKGEIYTKYLHKLIAESGLQKPMVANKKLFVRVINGNKLDCRLENLEWTTMSGLRRQEAKYEGYRGVSKDGNKFRAVIYDNGQRVYLGAFDNAFDAAKAYDEESIRRFGFTNSLNFRLDYEQMKKEMA
jgi:hypothetical protein